MFSRLDVIEHFNSYSAALSDSADENREAVLADVPALVEQCIELRKRSVNHRWMAQRAFEALLFAAGAAVPVFVVLDGMMRNGPVVPLTIASCVLIFFAVLALLGLATRSSRWNGPQSRASIASMTCRPSPSPLNRG